MLRLADQLCWTFVETHNRAGSIGRFGIEVEDVFHSTYVPSICGMHHMSHRHGQVPANSLA
jgi:hypothetical protein